MTIREQIYDAVSAQSAQACINQLEDEMTTAVLRARARAAEIRLDWETAATLYDQAADAYPVKCGDLAMRDIANLRRRAISLRHSVSCVCGHPLDEHDATGCSFSDDGRTFCACAVFERRY